MHWEQFDRVCIKSQFDETGQDACRPTFDLLYSDLFYNLTIGFSCFVQIFLEVFANKFYKEN